ncbi:HIT family protein [Alkalihalobacillus pseudalcaliphilus]|uniref:HIT family protein n=1 Tax=Alkalihalobacillus pseudalcaliphilus TaxID=79884 RepID=UPI00064D9689|nr:HIT domain-containing protein [Alkalihalobacillus pseudalcaliphilus]KMK75887.1 cell-cycle regulation histidine triad HIT protein [Alkalihalobacillus pseudalcaliphilus]
MNDDTRVDRCEFCHLELVSEQQLIFENEDAMFLQLKDVDNKGKLLAGAGVIVPKQHRDTVFDLTETEWSAMYELLQRVKVFIDERFWPDGYNVGWNNGAVAGQHIHHVHLHILPRYKDETLAGKGIRYMFKEGRNQRGVN